MPFTAPDTDLLDAPKSGGFKAPDADLVAGGFTAPASDLPPPLSARGAVLNQPSQFGSGYSTLPPSADGLNAEDWGFTGATRGGLPGVLADAFSTVSQKVVEPAAAGLLNAAGALGEGEAGIMPDASGQPAFVPGQSVIPDELLPLAKEKGVIPALTRALQGFTTPGSLLTLPAAGASKAVQSAFLSQALSSMPDAAIKLGQAQTPAEKSDALTELGLNTGMAYLMRHGFEEGGPTAPAAEAQPGAVPITFTPAEVAAAAEMQKQIAPLDKQTASPSQQTAGFTAPDADLANPHDDAVAAEIRQPAPPVAPAMTPDGRVDTVSTAIKQLQAEGQAAKVPTIAERAAAAPDKPVTMSDLSSLADEIKQALSLNQIKPTSEPTPPESNLEASQSGAGTAVPPAPTDFEVLPPSKVEQMPYDASELDDNEFARHVGFIRGIFGDDAAEELLSKRAKLIANDAKLIANDKRQNATDEQSHKGAQNLDQGQQGTVESQKSAVQNQAQPVRKTFFIRPRSDGVHDILDEVQTHGGLRSPGPADVGGEYDGYKESMTGAASLLRRRNGGLRPDDMVANVREAFPRIQSPDDLYQAIQAATKQRDKLRVTGGGHEAQTQRFWDAVGKPEGAKGVEKINVNQLAPGQTFRLKAPGISHDELTVSRIDPKTGEVTVKDGPNFGQQDLPPGTEIYIRKGTLKAEVRHAAGDFGGDLFSSPESVADQKARTASEKRAADEAKAKQTMQQRAAARLTGKDLDTTGDMFGGTKGAAVRQDKTGQGSLFAAGDAGQKEAGIVDSSREQKDVQGRQQSDALINWGYPHIRLEDFQSVSDSRPAYEYQLHQAKRQAAGFSATETRNAIEAVRNELRQEQTNDPERRARLIGRADGLLGVEREKFGQRFNLQNAVGDQKRGLEVQHVTEAVKSFLGTDKLPAGIRVVRDETAPWGAKIEGRNKITVNAAQISTPERAAQVILEEGLHGVWHDPAVKGAWDTIRNLVTPAEIREEYLKRQGQGLPTDPDTIREEAAIARLVKADSNTGVFAKLYDVVRNVMKRVFGVDLPTSARQQLKDAALEFLRNREGRQGARGDVEPARAATGDQPPLTAAKSELSDAEDNLKARTSEIARPEMGTLADRKQAAAEAAARYRTARETLATHPDHVAEQILKQHNALTEANQILKPMGKTVTPDDFPNPSEIAAKLGPEAAQRVSELANQAAEAGTELARTNRLAPKMVDRITGEMIADGRLPKMAEIRPDAGRTLKGMTDALNESVSDSPRGTFAERLALGRKIAERYAGAKDAVAKAWSYSMAAGKSLVGMFKANIPVDGEFRNVIKDWISYDQRTAVENFQYAKALTAKVPEVLRRKAMSVWLDADGDESLLKFQRDSVPEKYHAIWDTALKLTPKEKEYAQQIKAGFEAKLQDAKDTGMIAEGRQDYGVPQRWKKAPEVGEQAPDGSEARKGSPGNAYAKLDPRDPFFSFERKTPSYFEGIMKGGEPENLDVGHLVTHYDEAFHKALSSRGAIKALAEARAADGEPVVKLSGGANIYAADNKPIVVDSSMRPKDAVTADGRPYQAINHWALRDWKFVGKAGDRSIVTRGDMLIHPDHLKFLRNELNTPHWMEKASPEDPHNLLESAAYKALQFGNWAKSSKFIGPFHIVTEALHASFHGVVPSVHDFEVNLSDPTQARLARNMSLGFGRAREVFEEGLGSHGGIWAKVPGLGDAIVKLNNFTFSQYIPKLKMKVGLAVLARNEARYAGKLTPEQIAEVTGRQMDAAFGGQNWRLMGTDKNLIGIARLALVAPDFLLSRSKVIGQAFKPYNKEQRVFLAAQALGVYALARVANSIFSDDHDPHWEARNWDKVVVGKRAYSARFIVSDAANLARDLLGLGNPNQHGIPFITGRLGVIPKTAMELATGKDLFTGQNKDGLFHADNPVLKAFSIVAKDVSEWMTPMAVDGFMGGAKKGQTGLGQVAAATFGVSSRKESPAGQVWDLARQFNLDSKDPKTITYQKQRDNSTSAPSVYQGLNNLLDAGKLDQAKAEVKALLAQGKTLDTIQAHYDRNAPFTGNQERESAFVQSLSPDQRKVYQAAKAEQQARATALRQAMARP